MSLLTTSAKLTDSQGSVKLCSSDVEGIVRGVIRLGRTASAAHVETLETRLGGQAVIWVSPPPR